MRESADQQAFLHVSAEDLQEAGLEMCEGTLEFIPYCMVAWWHGAKHNSGFNYHPIGN